MLFRNRNWIEIDSLAAKSNAAAFRGLLGEKTKLWAVVKSNAYGHGLRQFAKIVNGGVNGFCVDTFIEGIKLRNAGIKKPILVLGSTLPDLMKSAAHNNLILSVSSWEALTAISKLKNPPDFHIKIDTGMHRQGFYPADVLKIIKIIGAPGSRTSRSFTGAYTHFASAKSFSESDRAYTDGQFEKFRCALRAFYNAGFKNLTAHCAATGAALLHAKYHMDAVRVGIGLYGLYPSKEFARAASNLNLKPVLSWRALVMETKPVKKGAGVGYDLTEKFKRNGKIAVLPIGYWHGLPRALSSAGEALINGRRARILGRVSMDLVVLDASKIPVSVMDVATLIGKDGRDAVSAWEMAEKAKTTAYEIIARINPTIERRVV